MNSEIDKNAKVLIISWSPVQTPKYQIIDKIAKDFKK